MNSITRLIRQDKEFRDYLDALRASCNSAEPLPLLINGLVGGAADAFLSESVIEAGQLTGLASLIIVGTEAEREATVLKLCSNGVRALALKLREPVYYNIAASHDVDRERLSVLYALMEGECDCVVATAAAAASFTMPKEELSTLSLSVSVGEEISPDSLSEKLSSLGFAYTDAVDGRGQFSRRGGIVDFWAGELHEPVRVEFFGDEIDRAVYFDPLTQRSTEPCDRIRILPAKEVIADAKARDRLVAVINKLLSGNISAESRQKLIGERSAVEAGLSLDFSDKYFLEIYGERTTVFDYLGDKATVFVLGSAACRENLEGALKRCRSQLEGLAEHGLCLPALAEHYLSQRELDERASRHPAVHVNPFAGGVSGMAVGGIFGFRSRRTVCYGDNIRMLFEDILTLRKSGYRMLLVAENRQSAEAASASLSEYAIDTVPVFKDEGFSLAEGKPGIVYVGVSSSEGFDLITPRIAVLSLKRDEGRAVMQRKRQQRIIRKAGGVKQLLNHAELSPGDYVVHANYGIGLFEGIEAVTVDGVTKDYVTIRYAGTDKLFVPCDRLEMLGKYIGERDRDGGVKLSKMGGTEWHKAKSRAKGAARDIAKRLIALYAERQRREGFAFPKDSELEDEFDSAFEYEETDSQLSAIADIKADMMRPVPMNRLLCGDVGFGKTEVALRAAFKAIACGKQVAILVPTTILALQHYGTALSRMRGYAVNVEMLSRFRSPKERERIISRTARGEVDLLIGTHALLSKKIKFRDLGLLIIDEEQRFGVVQKEKLREMSTNVDTLMLSATPIPRTLNMAMSGISDISVLDEAPGERRPVQTYVLEHDDGVVFDAIDRELARAGQVLYLYNKVEDIHVIASRISLAFPKARVAFAHGQMERDELEDIWQCLVRGEIDVLVCTTIIETGVDLPNANTLVIENADRFGLSQLHQIRGRVGRSERQAYAYFTYRPGKALTEVAEKRLSAIRDYAEFGAGFKIAMCDLEIRGAGNLLGAEQHGYIESVGYDLYIKLLNEAVLEERGGSAEAKPEAQIVIKESAHIPESYISSPAGRMETYKKILLIEGTDDYREVADELLDRYGDIPKTVERLLDVALSKALASRFGIKKIEAEGNKLSFLTEKPDLAVWSELFVSFPALRFAGASVPVILYRLREGEDACRAARLVMEEYSRVKDGDAE